MMRKSLINWIALLLFMSTSTATVAQSLIAPEGRYRWECGNGIAWEDSDGKLEVIGNELRFWESICTLTNPVNIRDLPNAVIYDATCSGEGETWKDRIVLSFVGNGETAIIDMIRKDGGITYQSCPSQ